MHQRRRNFQGRVILIFCTILTFVLFYNIYVQTSHRKSKPGFSVNQLEEKKIIVEKTVVDPEPEKVTEVVKQNSVAKMPPENSNQISSANNQENSSSKKQEIVAKENFAKDTSTEEISPIKRKFPSLENKHDLWTDGKKEREEIKQAFVFAYENYEANCLQYDELNPVTRACHNWLTPGSPLTLIDSLDTMLVMGLDHLYKNSIDYLSKPDGFTFSKLNADISVFEASIRFLGGLLGAYTFTGDSILLERAIEIGNLLAIAFNTPSGIPYRNVNFATAKAPYSSAPSLVDAGGSVQLEFAYLSHLTNNPDYVQKGLKVWDVIRPQQRPDKLYGNYINVQDGVVSNSEVSAGSFGDSFYEYVFKYFLLTNQTQKDFRDWFLELGESIIDNMAVPFENSIYIADLSGSFKIAKMQHLTCFTGGLFALASYYIPESSPEKKAKFLTAGKGVGQFCKKMYDVSPTKLPSENYWISGKNTMTMGTRFWIMRPEAVESWFILYRITGDEKYRRWAWEFFQTIQIESRVSYGFSGLSDAAIPKSYDHVQQSFFLAETLKYLYLIFTPDDFVPLTEFVFNTEAHIFPKFPHWGN